MDGDPGEGGDEAEIRTVLNEIENNDDGNQTVILAVVAPKDKGPLEQIVKRKRREGSLRTLRHGYLHLFCLSYD